MRIGMMRLLLVAAVVITMAVPLYAELSETQRVMQETQGDQAQDNTGGGTSADLRGTGQSQPAQQSTEAAPPEPSATERPATCADKKTVSDKAACYMGQAMSAIERPFRPGATQRKEKQESQSGANKCVVGNRS